MVAALAGALGCRPNAGPESLFAEADALRLRFEQAASRKAVSKYRQAMAAWSRKGDTRNAARAGQRLGATYGQLGSLGPSLEAYEAALALAVASGDRLLESDVRSDVGVAQALVADEADAFDRAGQQCDLALALARQARARRAEAVALTCQGEVAYYRQRPDDALAFYLEAVRHWDGLGDEQGLAHALLSLGSLYSDLSRLDPARESYERARSLAISCGDRRAQAIALVGDGRLLVRRGDYQEALDTFAAALALLEPMGDAVWEGSTLTGIGMVYQFMGETRLALKYWERALRIFEAARLHNVSVDVLNSLGETYLASGDDARALVRFERALALADELGIPRWRAFALRFIGVVHLFRRQPDRAQQYLEESLEIQRTLGTQRDPRLEARTWADLGEAHDVRGEPGAAIPFFDAALALAKPAGDRVAEARGLFGRARASMGLGRLEAARRYVEDSLAVVESLRTEVESRDLRASYFASVYHYNELHVDVLMRLHEAGRGRGLSAAAFATSERGRARSLLDSLMEAGVDLRSGLDPALLRREQQTRMAFEDWAQRVRRAGGPVPGATEGSAHAEEYRDLQEQDDLIQAEIKRRSPRYAALVRPEPIGVMEVQSKLLDGGTVLLEYALGEERSHLWAVSHRSHASYALPPRVEVERAAARVLDRLTARLAAAGSAQERRQTATEADLDYWREAARLSEMLLAPAATEIAGKRILVVADGALQYLPLGALPVPGRRGEPVPMLVEHEIVSLPSASALAALRREAARRAPPAGGVTVLADPVFEADDPRLRGRRIGGAARSAPPEGAGAPGAPPRLASTRLEAAAIAAAAPAGLVSRRLDFDASRATALSADLARARIVHFATHGVLDNEDPGLSGVMLSMFDAQGRPLDGFLRLRDIYTLRLPADLVVLSACSTALGRPVKGEGLVGVVRGFMYAGAQRVVASLWKVDDDATRELMSRFYVEMLQHQRSPASALRQAQLAVRQQDAWRSPFYWAGFVLQGEWQ
jgi:CHAT domain-containing protein/Tfp pilus assembly protein PilF